MTLGERIQENRKNLGLSQEALGEKLGVTRQSISKWESDSAIPELDKLIALSRLFHIPVGALLGVEEEGEPDRELTERELKALSAIAEKLTPPSEKKRKKPVLVFIGAALILLGLTGTLASRLEKLENRVGNLQNNMSGINSNLGQQINAIGDRVEEILESQNRVTAAMGSDVTGADLAAGTVTFRVWATPRIYREGMTAHFTAAPANEKGETLSMVTFEGTEGEGHRFEALLTCSLTDDVTLSVTFRSGDESQNQIVERIEGLKRQSIPDIYVHGGLFLADITVTKEGTARMQISPLNASWVPGLNPVTGEEIEPVTVRARLWRGDQLLCSWPMTRRNERGELLEVSPDELTWLDLPDLQEGEIFYLSAQVEDSVGRRYELWLDDGKVEVGGTHTSGGVTTVTRYDILGAVQTGSYPWTEAPAGEN